MATSSNDIRERLRSTAPKLMDLTDKVVFGDVWERSELSKRDRSLITVAMLVAMHRDRQLPAHLDRAMDNGVTQEELVEVITHAAFYAGWPCAMTAATIAKDFFDQRGA
jgi:4-carboxymuconolactone decarboxylase